MSSPAAVLATPAAPAVPLHQKFNRLGDVVGTQLFEREKEIRTALLAIVAGVHHFQLGTPGLAKTMLVDRFVRHIDGIGGGGYFRWLMTPFTTPEEIFGPPSLKALENDEYRRNTTRKLPEAVFGFLDEGFKANSAILNSLLTIMLERLFFNNGGAIEVPLSTLFIGSNEKPKGVELSALYDRIDLRIEVKPLHDRSSKMAMLKADLAKVAQSLPPEKIVTLDDILQAKAEVRKVVVPDDVLEKLLQLEYSLNTNGIFITPRRLNTCPRIIQASAWLNGRTEADADDMRDLRFVMSDPPGDFAAVERLVFEVANPIDREAMEILDTIDKLTEEAKALLADDATKTQRRRQGVEIHQKLDRCGKDLKRLREKGNSSGRRSEKMEEANRRLTSIVTELLRELFDIEEDPA